MYDSEASSSDTSSVFSLSHFATDASKKARTLMGNLEPYLLEPIAKNSESSNNTPDDDAFLRTMRYL